MSNERDELELSDAGPDESQKQMPLLGGIIRPEGLPEAADLDLQSLKGGSKLLNHGTLIVLAIVLVAGGALYAMRVSQGDLQVAEGAKVVEARIEQALAKLSAPESLPANDPLHKDSIHSLFQDTQSIVSMFSADPSERQVPVRLLKKDPFQLAIERPVADAPVAAVPNTDREAEARMRRLRGELDGLKLQSVVQGPRPIAIINGEFYQPGQQVGSFTVGTISGTTVELLAMGQRFKLSMEVKDPRGNTLPQGLR